MASYRGHLMVSSGLGVVYGVVGAVQFDIDVAPAIIGGGVTALGGLLPDLDSDSGVPIRELFGLSAAVVPILMLQRLEMMGLGTDITLLVMAGIYLFIRYGLSRVLKRVSVHRGMFHSIPAMLIAGCITFLAYDENHESEQDLHHLATRAFVALGTTLGFLSHLLLDEFSSVDFRGGIPKLNKYAGSAMKLFSPSVGATSFCYMLLGVFGYLVWFDVGYHLGYSPMNLIDGTGKP